MRQLTFVSPGRMEWRDVAEPRLPDADGTIVRPLAVARCDLDRPMAQRGLFPGPFGVGHEVAAQVVAVGERVARRGLETGSSSLSRCRAERAGACRGGRLGGCETHRASIGAAFGFGAAGGGHGGAVADLLAVPAADHLLVPLPDGLDPVVACTLPDNVVDHLPAVLELVAAGRLDPLAVPTRVAPWDDADRAWLEPATKLVLDRAGRKG